MKENLFLQGEDIHIGFGGRKVLTGVDIEVHSGEALAIIGPNGSGKSTLLKILSGILSPQKGTVCLKNRAIQKYQRDEIAREIAVIPQSTPQIFHFSLVEFVLMGFHARTPRFALPSKNQYHQAVEALEKVGLKKLRDQPVSSLSGGELQRALLARAMVAQTDLWLLDEPTASLDMRHQIQLLNIMRSHIDNGGSALAILHDLSMVHRFFDSVMVLVEGRIRAFGSPDDVLTDDLLTQVYGVPMVSGHVENRRIWVAS